MLILASTVTVLSTYIHWRRFRVPITMAVGMAATTVLIVSLSLSLFENLEHYLALILFFMGLVVFFIAMYWDSRDKKRITNDADIAFWLHLLASPLIIHSIFLGLNIFDNEIGLVSIITIVVSYIFLSIFSLVIDRRALMVSSLLYVLYSLNRLFTEYGFEGYGLAMGGVIIGFGLLFLTAFWARARGNLVKIMPEIIKDKIPQA